MAGASKILLLFVIFSLALVGIRGDAGVEDDEGEAESLLNSELDRLKSKIAALESKIAEGSLQLKAKDEALLQSESVIKEKAEILASLHAEIESVQKKGASDVAELEGKARAQTVELEKQINKLKSDIQAQGQKRDALEARAVEAEKKVEELNLRLESLQKTNDEQKSRIKKTGLALKKAEEELMKVLSEASSKKKELIEINGAWLPPWLSAHLGHCQATAAAHWKEHGKPTYDAFLQKASQVLAQARKKVEPHLETTKGKWIPTLKEHWVTVRTSAEPYAQLVATKTLEIYETSVMTLKSYLIRVQDTAHPYFQEAKKSTEPYIDQATMFVKPHVEKVQTVLKPYSEQAQSAVKGLLKKYGLTKALAVNPMSKTKEKCPESVCKSCSSQAPAQTCRRIE